MTGKIKRRSLRCGGRPKADFGSLFTSVIAPALNATGSIVDESIDNNKTTTNGVVNKNTIIPSDPTKTPTMRLGGRKKCWIGAAIGAATSIAGSLFGNSAKKREMRRQQSIKDWQNTTQEAANMTTALNNSQDYQEDYLRQFRTAARLGKTLGTKGIYITDGGDATKIGNNTYLLRGGSHENVNETGQTGIGINVGGNEVEAEGGEVAQKKNDALRIFSAQPILGNGMSPAQAILRGYNKDKVFSQQQAFKRRNGLKDDGSAKYGFGGDVKGIWNFIRSYRTPVDNIAALVTAYQKLNPNSNYNKQKGKFKGGTFRGAGVGGSWTNDYKSNKGFDNFNDAYDDAVEHNAKTFIFGNKRYNTLKENNPIREINNRAVGSWRDSVVTKDRTGYGKDFGLIKGGASLIPVLTETYNPKRIKHRLGGGLTSKDKGSSKHPYPSVSSKDFAGGGRSYPIPTKADAVDALRLAGLHGRSDVRSKIYSRYPELRKKARGGAEIEPYYDWARNTSSNLGISFIDPTYDYRAYYDSVTPYERALIRFAPQGTHFTDIGKTPKHPTFSNESKYSNNKTPGGTWNGNVFVPNIWQFGNNGNSRRNKYMNNSGEGYFNGRVNVFPTSRKRHSLGGCSRPVKGMRPKAATGIFVPYNKRYTSIYDAPDYDSDYNGGNVLGNGEVTVTAKRIKPTFMKPNNDAMNLIKVPKEEDVPYIPQRHNRNRTIFSGGDYLGLGIDTLAALSTGLVNYNTAGKYVLPDRAPIIQASKLPTTYNVNPEIEEVKRYRDRLTGQTFNNTSSSVAALNRSSAINLDALSNLSKLWATKENEENKMLTEDAKNQQTVAAQNVQNELVRQSEIARIKNEAIQAKGDALNVGLSGLSQAWTNFWTAGRTAYEDDQARRAMVASSKDATPTRLIEMGYDLSPDLVASLYRTAKDDRTKRFYLSRLSSAQRQKYGIN